MGEARRRFLIVTVAALAAVALTARLGVWQLDRAAQKRAMQAAIDAGGRLAPLGNADLQPDDSQLHRAVRLRGHWLADRTVYLENRPMHERVGFYVVTPLQLADRSEAILVQRGWAPRDARDRTKLPELPAANGEIELTGRLELAPTRVFELGEAASGPIRQNLASAAFAQEAPRLKLLPLTVFQTQPAGAGDDLPRDWPAPDLGLSKHYGYAFQWFALSALFLGLYVWFQLIQPRHHKA
ncbi:SURF1 family protein [Pelomonas sp. KK5]|uniref:SURF1 family protein n=1 Tax=Pelomonas sp. KK5 TaxID=1855730 RepID=UPI00097BB635|nr:SURF1 family protein [Pelomonas sp. KK5]